MNQENKKLEQSELDSLKQAVQNTAELEAAIAKLSIRRLSIQGEIDSYFEKWKHHAEQLEGIRKSIAEKYGDGSISIEDGTFTPKE
jgi:chromosome segregation ATPase